MHVFPNGKRYIGLTKQNPLKRWGKNGSNYNKQVVYNAILKYGWDNIEHIIVATDLTHDEAVEKEKELITKYKTTDNRYGYNFTDGGEGVVGYTHTEEWKSNMSEVMSRRTGELNHNYGKHFSEEHKRKLSEANKKWVKTEEMRKHMSEGQKRATYKRVPHKYTQEEKEYRSKKRKYEMEVGLFVFKKEWRDKSVEVTRRPVRCIETGIIYPSIKQASRETNTNASGISNVLAGRIKSTKGLHWEYVDKETN